jgi:hypothetical protein
MISVARPIISAFSLFPRFFPFPSVHTFFWIFVPQLDLCQIGKPKILTSPSLVRGEMGRDLWNLAIHPHNKLNRRMMAMKEQKETIATLPTTTL